MDCCTSSGGAATDNELSLFKASEGVCTVSARFGKGARIHRVEWRQVFATPPCKGQLRLAIVVAAETVPHVIGGSFCVKGRNCALDVCWEGKKFRVICSHLNLSSVMHLYAKDLDDLRSLVSSRASDTHVHICVDAQTGLGTMPPRPLGTNIGTATTVSHRVEKQRMFECYIMENLLTATNTFRFEDDGAINDLHLQLQRETRTTTD